MATMLPVAVGMAGGGIAERSYDSLAGSTLNSEASDESERSAAKTPNQQAQATASGTSGTDKKREGPHDSSDDHESAKKTWTRSKSSSLAAGGKSAPSQANAQSDTPFASVFADAVSAAGAASAPAQAAAEVPAQSPAPATSASRLADFALTAAANSSTAEPLGQSASRTAPRDSAEPNSGSFARAVPASQTTLSTSAPVLSAPPAHLSTTAGSQTAAEPADTKGLAQDAVAAFPAAAQAAASKASAEPAGLKVTAIGVQSLPATITAAAVEPQSAGASLSSASTPAAATIGAAPNASAALIAQAQPPAGGNPPATGKASAKSSSVAAPAASSSKAATPLFERVTLQSLQTAPNDLPVNGVGAQSDSYPGSSSDTNPDSSQSLNTPRKAEQAETEASSSADKITADSAFSASASAPFIALPSASGTSGAAVAAVAQSSIQERIDVAHQLADRISAAGSASALGASAAATRKLTVDISPQHWGRMQITLTQSPADAAGTSQATATIVTESEAARQALLGQIKDLRASLQSGGVKLDKIEILASGKDAAAAFLSGSADSVVAGAAATGSGSLAGNTNQQQLQQHSQHSHSGARFEFASGSSGAGADASGSGQRQGGQPRFSGPLDDSGGLAQIVVPPQASGPTASPADLDADAGVNVLA